jgi:hypothetical protein
VTNVRQRSGPPLVCVTALSAAAQDVVLQLPFSGRIYHGVYPGGIDGEEDDITLNDVLRYEAACGKQVAWVYFLNNWYRSRAFPLATAKWIRADGAMPYIRLRLRSEDHKRGEGNAISPWRP